MPAEDASPHDVLAAEEFVLPAPDPALTDAEPHDVLAAEEFVLPAPDPVLAVTHWPLELPASPYDPVGAEPPHDVLAAEEFAVPGTVASAPHAAGARPRQGARVAAWALLLGGGVLLSRRRRRTRRGR